MSELTKRLESKLYADFSTDGNKDVYSSVSGKMRYRTIEEESFRIGEQTFSRKEVVQTDVAHKAALREAIKKVRTRLAFDEKNKQTFAGLVKERLNELGRVYRGSLAKSIVSDVDVSLTQTEANEKKRDIRLRQTGEIGSEQQYEALVNQNKKYVALGQKLKKDFGGSAAYRLAIEVNLRALGYYEMIDQGIKAGDAKKFYPKKITKLMAWVAAKIPSASTPAIQEAISWRILKKWDREGREAENVTQYAIDRYKRIVTLEVERELKDILTKEGIAIQTATADGAAISEIMEGFALQYSANVSKVQYAIANAAQNYSKALGLQGSVARASLVANDKTRKKKKKTITKAVKTSQDALSGLSSKSSEDEILAALGKMDSMEFGGFEGFE